MTAQELLKALEEGKTVRSIGGCGTTIRKEGRSYLVSGAVSDALTEVGSMISYPEDYEIVTPEPLLPPDVWEGEWSVSVRTFKRSPDAVSYYVYAVLADGPKTAAMEGPECDSRDAAVEMWNLMWKDQT